MKKNITLICLCFVLAAGAQAAAAELLVFAGSGMRVPLEELGRDFSREQGGEVAFDFDGSGRLGTKILMGVQPDLFIPGSDKWAIKLRNEGYLGDCVPVAYHTPIIITTKGFGKIRSLHDLTRKDVRLALADAKAAAIGRNNERLFKQAGLDPADMNIVARGINVKQLVRWVETGSVDAAIVWHADAVQSDLVEAVEIAPESNQIDSIPLCLMKNPAHPEDAARFWTYLRDRGPAVFSRHGFRAVDR
jgi:molybdate transport system substrate-binding protein